MNPAVATVDQPGIPLIGIALGVLIGCISAIVFLWLIKALSRHNDLASGLKIIAETLAIPSFWFGGPWVCTATLRDVNWTFQLSGYAIALVITFFSISAKSMWYFIIRMANDVRSSPPSTEEGGKNND